MVHLPAQGRTGEQRVGQQFQSEVKCFADAQIYPNPQYCWEHRARLFSFLLDVIFCVTHTIAQILQYRYQAINYLQFHCPRCWSSLFLTICKCSYKANKSRYFLGAWALQRNQNMDTVQSPYKAQRCNLHFDAKSTHTVMHNHSYTAILVYEVRLTACVIWCTLRSEQRQRSEQSGGSWLPALQAAPAKAKICEGALYDHNIYPYDISLLLVLIFLVYPRDWVTAHREGLWHSFFSEPREKYKIKAISTIPEIVWWRNVTGKTWIGKSCRRPHLLRRHKTWSETSMALFCISISKWRVWLCLLCWAQTIMLLYCYSFRG